MPTYVIADVEVTDPDGFEAYRRLAIPTLRKYGGRVRASDDEIAVLEGDWRPTRLAIVEFDNLERARQWYQSAEYAEAKPILHRTARANLILIEGA